MFRPLHVVLVLAVAASSGAQQPVSGLKPTTVSVRVTVTDRRNGFVTDPAPADFEDRRGRPSAGRSRTSKRATAASGREPHLGLLLDTSASMGADIDHGALRVHQVPEHAAGRHGHDARGLRHGVRVASAASATFRGWSSASGRGVPRASRRSTTRWACSSMAPPKHRAGRFWSSSATAVTPAAASGSRMSRHCCAPRRSPFTPWAS